MAANELEQAQAAVHQAKTSLLFSDFFEANSIEELKL